MAFSAIPRQLALMALVPSGLLGLACGTSTLPSSTSSEPDATDHVLPVFDAGTEEDSSRGSVFVPTCPDGGSTSLSGTTFAPDGKLALYNVIVFVPTGALQPLSDRLTCDQCGTVGAAPVASATSDATGHFVLHDVPSGDNVPLVVQLGKWRRQVVLPHVEPCTGTVLTDPELTRLPRKQSEGHLPRMAVTTGGCDQIACVLPKIGVDASEFGVAADFPDKRVIFYQGARMKDSPVYSGATPAPSLWSDFDTLAQFDTVIFSCECSEFQDNKSDAARAAVARYLDSGGRTFQTDFGYTWIHQGPSPMPTVFQNFVGGAPGDGNGQYAIDTTFPKGAALSDWLMAVQGTTTSSSVNLTTVFRNFGRANLGLSQRWVYSPYSDQVLSFTTPLTSPADSRCGKAVYLDLHVGDSKNEIVDGTFPASCGSEPLTPQEKLMVFFLMDLASCIQNDTSSIVPPR
ncbi:MAG: hypothetical protein WCI05_12840 [Myxococcales bacterium]